jgi:hypothetical protein
MNCCGCRLDRSGLKKQKPPLGLHRRGSLNFRSFFVSTYLLAALDGASGTTRTTFTTRTTGTKENEMTNVAVAIASAISSPKACASRKVMVVKSNKNLENRLETSLRKKTSYLCHEFSKQGFACEAKPFQKKTGENPCQELIGRDGEYAGRQPIAAHHPSAR